MVLIDLGGTVLFRSDKKDCGQSCNYKFKKYQYWWRPGYKEMILKLVAHPRVFLGFYSSMMLKTITPTYIEFMHDSEGKLDAIRNQQKIVLFDRDYCKLMKELDHYKPAMEESYDTYRDL